MNFSVVIPLFNKEKFIARAVAGIESQTLQPAETIIVDDGSTDTSADIVRGMAAANIKLIEQPNAGPGPARNTGAFASRSDWVAFLDADDVWLPNHLEELARVIRQKPSAAMVSTSYAEIPVGAPVPDTSSSVGAIEIIDYFATRANSRRVVHSSGVAIRKDVFAQLGGFHAFYPGQDTHFWAILALQHEIAVSSLVTSVFLRGTGGISDAAPKARKSIEPTTALLLDVLQRGGHPQHKSIEAFLNTRSFIKIKSAILSANIREARALLAEVRELPKDRRMRLASLCLALPAPAIYPVISLARRLKSG